MKFRFLTTSIILLLPFVVTLGQNRRVTITADISGFSGKLPVSFFTEWQGDDTLVPAVIKNHMPNIMQMGAEYLVFFNSGDSTNPNTDSIPGVRKKIRRCKAKIDNNLYSWVFETDQPCLIGNYSLLGGTYLVIPGDSIHISYIKNYHEFSGKGAAKFKIAYQLNEVAKNVILPDKRVSSYEFTLERYLKRHHYHDEKIKKMLSVLEENASELNQLEYDWLKANMLASIENDRLGHFTSTWQAKMKNSSLPYSYSDLIKVWDTTMYKSTAKWLRSAAIQNMPGIGRTSYAESFHLIEMRRKFNFIEHDSVSNRAIFKKLIYKKLKNNYLGLFRERLLCKFIQEEIIQEGFAPYNWFMKSILDDYYNTPGFPAYKGWMKELEKSKEMRYAGISSAGVVPLFNVKDQTGLDYTQQHTAGKITIVNFWYSGCEPCKQTAKELTLLQKRYERETNVIFLHVSVDSNVIKWKKAVKEGSFVPKGGTHLYTGGLGKKHEMLRDFNVQTYPTIRMYDLNGRIYLNSQDPLAQTFSGSQLDDMIGSQLAKFKDGPYIFSTNGAIKGYTIQNDQVNDLEPKAIFTTATDQYNKQVNFLLQKQLIVPPTNYPVPSQMLVLSDIEGNFTAFRKLLQANKVIDAHFNWTFDSGHLVFAGDMFDRGDQVTECLWLIYSLEEKARATGGWVHFILGNHEIMNLSGNDKYVIPKYKKNYALMGKTLSQVYGEESELGRWLRTKNIVEKIGSNLFCHGGISSEINRLDLTLEDINKLARPHYAKYKNDYGNEKINTIMSSSTSPFWCREYYKRSSAVQETIDSSLQKFNVTHIITGHTIVADTISLHFTNKVINTDTRHAFGKSEALLIENNNYYRVSHNGDRVLLFKENIDLVNIRSNNRYNYRK